MSSPIPAKERKALREQAKSGPARLERCSYSVVDGQESGKVCEALTCKPGKSGKVRCKVERKEP